LEDVPKHKLLAARQNFVLSPGLSCRIEICGGD
jgi:hypothetical protein